MGKWIQGMLSALRGPGVQILQERDWREMPETLRNTSWIVVPKVCEGWGQQWDSFFVQPHHATALGMVILSGRNNYLDTPPTDPDIGILNRRGSREIENEKEIGAALRKRFASVCAVTFDNKTFNDQVQYMHDHHIIISPHGAQLSSVCFMRPCSALLEIFPKYYWIPGSLNTLARDAGLFASWLYLSDAPSPLKETDSVGIKQRRAAKDEKICVPVD